MHIPSNRMTNNKDAPTHGASFMDEDGVEIRHRDVRGQQDDDLWNTPVPVLVNPADGISITSGHLLYDEETSLASPPDQEFLEVEDNSSERRYHKRNMAFLIAGFCFNYTAFLALQSLQSSLNSKNGIGLLGLAVMAFGTVISATLISPPAIKYFGELRLLQYSAIGFANLIAANALRIDTYLVLSFAVFGLMAGMFWPSQYRYLTLTAKAYSRVTRQPLDSVLTHFNGAFFTFFVTTHFSGNLLSSLILQQQSSALENVTANASTATSTAVPLLVSTQPLVLADNSTSNASTPWYFGDCPSSDANFKLLVDEKSRLTLMAVFGALVTLGAICMFNLRPVIFSADSKKRNSRGQSANALLNKNTDSLDEGGAGLRERKARTLGQRVRSTAAYNTLSLISNPKMYRLIPIIFMSAVLKSFVYGDFNHFFIAQCIGTSQVGYAMACFGGANALSNVLVTKIAVRWGRPTVYIIGITLAVIMVIFSNFWRKQPSQGILFAMSAIWGMIDAMWNPQICSFLGILFPTDPERAYANYNLFNGLGFTVSFLTSSILGTSYTTVFIKSGLVIPGLPLAFLCYYKNELEYARWRQLEREGHELVENPTP